jgi:hypothetical protein
MITQDLLRYVERRVAVLGYIRPQFDIFTWRLPVADTRHVTDGRRAHYYLLTSELPQGLTLLSESDGLVVNAGWTSASALARLVEFSGQISAELPSPGTVTELTFLRIQEGAPHRQGSAS